jgi:polyhydroxybutyrate depolymerase
MACRRAVAIAAVASLLAALIACGETANTRRPSQPAAGSPPAPPGSTTRPTPDPEPSVEDFVVGGDRPVTVHVPADLDPRRPAPLLVLLHGYGASGEVQERYLRLRPQAARMGFLYAAPDGTTDAEGNRFWNATDACCDFGRTGVDDVDYLAGVIEEIGATVAVDPARTYVVGHSNGGFMAYALACRHAGVVAAIVSLAGMTYLNADDCRPATPVAVLHIHGTADEAIRFDGGRLDPGRRAPALAPYPSVAQTASLWQASNGCDASLRDLETRVDVDGVIDGPDGPAETTIAVATGCDPGGHVEVWTIPDGRHIPDLSTDVPVTVSEFLLAHSRPRRRARRPTRPARSVQGLVMAGRRPTFERFD